MNEASLNTIIGTSFPWHFKPRDNTGQLLCFDGFAIYKDMPVYWESKNLHKPSSFNFKRLEEHQIENLLTIQKALGKKAMCLFIVCVDFGRGDKRVFLFRDMQYIKKRKEDKKNILKKEFLARKNYIKIKKQLVDFEELLSMPEKWEYEY